MAARKGPTSLWARREKTSKSPTETNDRALAERHVATRDPALVMHWRALLKGVTVSVWRQLTYVNRPVQV